MRVNIPKNKLIVIFGYITYLIIVIYAAKIFQSIDYNHWFKMMFWIIISHVLITFICFEILKLEIFSISGIFISLSYIFHLGQVLIKGFTDKYVFSFDISQFMDERVYKDSVVFSLIIISLVSLGMMLAKTDLRNSKIKSNIKDQESSKTLIKLGWLVFIFTFPLELYYSFNKFIAAQSSGYLAVLEVESSGVLSLIARFHLIGLAFLIMGYSRRSIISIIIFMLYAAYSISTMVTGGRIYQTLSLLVLSYVLIKSKKIKFNMKVSLTISVGLFFMIVLLNTIADMRLDGLNDINAFSDTFVSNLNNNPIYDILEEFGGTFYTVCLALLRVPDSVEYSHGAQFVTSFLSVLPNINGVFSEINEKAIFTYNFNAEALGGSYIGELYYSFQYTSYLVAILLGFLIQVFSGRFEYHLTHKNFLRAIYFVIPTFALLLWIRGYYIGLLRNSIWSVCFIYIIYKFYLKKYSENED